MWRNAFWNALQLIIELGKGFSTMVLAVRPELPDEG